MEQNFCENCKVHLRQGTSHCPLCGHFIVEPSNNDSARLYPKYKPITERTEPMASILIKLGLLAIVLCMGLDLFIYHTISFSLYVLVSILYLILVVLIPLKRHSTMAQVMSRLAYYTTGLLLFCELFTHSWGWGVCIAIPAVWLGLAIISGICMLSFGYVNFEMFKPMFSIAILSTISLILLACFDQTTWLTLATVCFSWTEIALMFMFRFKRSIRSLKKEFRI